MDVLLWSGIGFICGLIALAIFVRNERRRLERQKREN